MVRVTGLMVRRWSGKGNRADGVMRRCCGKGNLTDV